jgi:hypothetical protein
MIPCLRLCVGLTALNFTLIPKLPRSSPDFDILLLYEAQIPVRCILVYAL